MRIFCSFFGNENSETEDEGDDEDEDDDESIFSKEFLTFMFINKVLFIFTWFIELAF